MIKAFIFDMDGVLSDTASVSVFLVTSYLKSKNIEAEDKDVVKNLGKGMERLFLDSASSLGVEIDIADALGYSKKVYPSLLAQKERMGGVNELLEKLKRCGIKIAVASSAPLWRVEANIKAMGLEDDFFDAVITEGDIKRNKPYPDIFLEAMIKLGVDPNESIVFEDSIAGIEAGKKSGAYTCALTTSIGHETMDELEPSFIIKDLSAFPSFHSKNELCSVLDNLIRGQGALKYGANWVVPCQKEEGIEKKAVEEAERVMLNAYAPYSSFRVGAAVVSAQTGIIYSGCNMENASYGATICAERNAITTAVAAEGVIGIDMVVVASETIPPAQPCAVCLQVMSEFIRSETPVILVSTKGKTERYLYSDLLPHPFEFGE